MIKAVLFDLDGTLLPLDTELYAKVYFERLGATLAPHGISPEIFGKAMWFGIEAMKKNDGRNTNEKIFWQAFESIVGKITDEQMAAFDYFYESIFPSIKEICGYQPLARVAIDMIKEKGLKLALATAPVFPETATRQRAGWGGIYFSDFELVTTFENSFHTKPSPDYYTDVANALGVPPSECLMIGNDAYDDMIAEKVGMNVYLITDNLLNKKNIDISKYNSGSFSDMIEFLKQVLENNI